MERTETTSGLAGPGIMLLSAGLFGYFGFTSQWISTGANGQYLFFVDLLEWTLKGSAVLFLLSALLTFVQPLAGNIAYGVTGLLGAVLLVAVAVLDFLDPNHMVMSLLLLLLFAAWNGYGSWTSLRAILLSRRTDFDAR